MFEDMCTECAEGIINIRAGAIIMKEDQFLMVSNETADYLYSVGGRIRFGETAEEAVIREVYEETGVRMETERLGFVHENYFFAEDGSGKSVYEISFFFYMKVPEDYSPVSMSLTADGHREYLHWVSADTEKTIYPEFFRTELSKTQEGVKHIVTDDRGRIGNTVTVTVDRPLGSAHPEHPDLIYPVNYGYVKGVMAADGEAQDAYILGVNEPVSEFTGILTAVIHRLDDVEDKWVIAPCGRFFTDEEIAEAVKFQEQYFRTVIRR